MKTVTIEDLMKDEFFQQKMKELQSDEELSALLGSYRIVVPTEDGDVSEVAKQLADMTAKLGYEADADAIAEAINSADGEELDENALEDVAGGLTIRFRIRVCRRICYRIGRWRICYRVCF